ncbi:hypothetical protein [Blastopirellula retiformator]|uniref:Uncharacterized protein n=1 Tax=Blastopirellula retiformator TaxID=2527970 RepID=A0A5C5V838_9BACT|nr:hypothetical protein [Blastopirellula retiformator]TWT34123.1 hypothetical protein Enr8_15160 [Blastopirellula retiformator]
MGGQLSKVECAVSLDGEFAQLQQVLFDLADHGRKRSYAEWLTQQGDPRGAFLNAVLDDWDAGQETLADGEIAPVWQDVCGVTLLQKLRAGKLDDLAAGCWQRSAITDG